MKKSIAIAICTVMALCGLGAAPASANGSPGCVTSREFAKVRNGMSKDTVATKFGTRGKRETIARSGGYSIEIRSYHTCTAYGSVAVSFDNGLVSAKTGIF